MKRDGHIHTPFCPHGTKDTLDSYIEEAINQGFSQLTFTEHAPLPFGFIDSTPTQDSGMELGDLDAYFSALQRVKKEYAADISIQAGLEVDYIEGFEKETTAFLDEYGPLLDDSVLSVHFLKEQSNWYCLDYSADVFEDMIGIFGSLTAIYKKYYETVHRSIKADLGPFKPKRIGHITLVHKFQHRFPNEVSFDLEIDSILTAIKENGYEIDFNGAGLMKPLCLESYPSPEVAQKALDMGISLVYGSDAHQAKDIGQGYDKLFPLPSKSISQL
ncbi:histidinol phosphatase [Bacillus sp. FJAT-27231]|uniref:histidinol-phosphatase HisJ n=1 Tax=Bacillus sp. FJAT-27231 TaxID=1679168 RepID=UPI000670801B|nr:histidinol-phosphatase HisJ [Bacillus sp. FJAT-27231]KMY55068.1 histidinol phosphatase [Bacillus sp. FJAT-27231]